jgi:hypothetical protein
MNLLDSDLFGDDFYQDDSIIQISKASLGLQPKPYTAEAIFLALILRALKPFEGVITGNGLTLTGNNQPITYRNSRFYDRLNLFSWQRAFGSNRAGQPVERRLYVLEIRSPSITEEQTIEINELE